MVVMMKTTAAALSLGVAVIASVLLLWHHARISRDREDSDFRRCLAGVWSWEFENMRCTNVVAPDGGFTCHSLFVHPDRTNTYQMAGTWQVEDGRLIEIVKSDSNKTARTPRTRSGRIIRVDTDEFMVAWPGGAYESVWKRVSHQEGLASAVEESFWKPGQGVDCWENLRSWVPAVDESFWEAKQFGCNGLRDQSGQQPQTIGHDIPRAEGPYYQFGI